MHVNHFVLAVVLNSAAALADPESGRKLNAAGFEAYKRGDLAAAAYQFEQATHAAPLLAVAHYNLAAVRSASGTCDTPLRPLLDELALSIELDPGRLERAKVDTDFDAVRATVGFQRILGADPRSVAGVTQLLPRVKWRPGPPARTANDSMQVRFLPAGKFELDALAPTDGGTWLKRSGKWRVEGAGNPAPQIVIDVPAASGLAAVHWVGQLLEDGRLVFDASWWTDAPFTCVR